MYRGAAAIASNWQPQPSVSVCVAENMVSVQCPQVYSQCAVLCTLCSVLVNAGPPYLLPLTGQASELSLSPTFSFFGV